MFTNTGCPLIKKKLSPACHVSNYSFRNGTRLSQTAGKSVIKTVCGALGIILSIGK
jgi:hypothetical protein